MGASAIVTAIAKRRVGKHLRDEISLDEISLGSFATEMPCPLCVRTYRANSGHGGRLKCGGPPPHRHDFEEMFTIPEGEIELTFRGEVKRAVAGSTVNIPANAPHFFRNTSDRPARLLCMCTPAGQEDEQAERVRRAKALAAKYRTELLV